MAKELSSLSVSEDSGTEIRELLDKNFAVTDSNVYRFYRGYFNEAYVITAGEQSKTMAELEKMLSAFLSAGLDRKSTIVVVGGGVAGDLAGFAASVYMRGIKVIQVPTSLLAMVDSSIGGKTAVNMSVKNLVGTFHQPEKIIISTHFLDTLPERELLSGIGEIIKTSMLEPKLFDYVAANIDKLKDCNRDAMLHVIDKCARLKAEITAQDERETGLRKVLNIGHTVGHALEMVDGFKLSHGEYVAKGIMIEAALFKERIDKDFYDRLIKLCGSVVCKSNLMVNEVIDYMSYDKKNAYGRISFVIARAPGKTEEIMLTPHEVLDRAAIGDV